MAAAASAAEAALAELLSQLWPRVGANSRERRAVAKWQLERLERLVVPVHAGVLMQQAVAPRVCRNLGSYGGAPLFFIIVCKEAGAGAAQ